MINSKKISKKIFRVVFLCFLFCLSCTDKSKRPNSFSHNFKQGLADYLYNISDILGNDFVLQSEEVFFTVENQDPKLSSTEGEKKSGLLKYPVLSSKGGYSKQLLNSQNLSNLVQVQTAKSGEKVNISFAQENIHIDPSISFINKYEILDYKILNSEKTKWNQSIAKLVGQVEKFKGFPNTIYSILPLLEGNHLVLYKLGPEDKIPYDELPLAKRVGDLLAVPFAGYSVRYCVAEVVPDLNDRKTGQYKPKCDGVKLKFAEYIELKGRNKKLFQYHKKPDLFPRDFFSLSDNQNNWFYVRTIVKSPDNEIVGHQFFEPANLVEFHLAPNKLDILDASSDDIQPEDRLRALFIPVEWQDFQIKRDTGNMHPSFREELKKDTRYEELRYFKINFNKLVENEVGIKGEKTLKNVFITDDYFSFSIEITGEGSKGAYLIKYAFFKKPVNSSYIPKQWFEEDSALFFPSFSEERKYYTENKSEFHSEEDHNKFLRTNRFDPQAKEIKWYFSKQTPNTPEDKWVREIGVLAVDILNKAFEVAGRDSEYELKIVLDDTGADKEVGDIRYNILNLLLTEGAGGGLLGLGPNVANPITGEVVSATANVWVSNILGIYTRIVRKHIRFETYKPSWALQPFSRDAELLDSLNKQIHPEAPEECIDLYFKPLGTTPFLHEKIESLCPEVTVFIASQSNKGLANISENQDLEDKEVIESCAKKLAFLPIIGITLHEILHGFSQRHVFSASVDTENFYKNHNEIEEIFGTVVSDKAKEMFGDFSYVEGTKCHPQPPQYSSVMDYMSFHHPMLYVPGKLDIAALRFIYFDKVDLKNGEVLEVPSGADKDPEDPQKSILETYQLRASSEENLIENDKLEHYYKVLCGGEKIDKDNKGEINPQKPLCRRFDYGSNPLQIAVNSILLFNNFNLMNGRNRYDSKRTPYLNENRFMLSVNKTLGDLYKKWEQYREELFHQKNQKMENYSFFNEEDVETYQEMIEAEKNTNPEFEMYYDIRKPIFTYMKRLLFMPKKHCIYKNWQNSDNKYHAVSLKNIRDEKQADYLKYPNNSRERLVNCQSPMVQKWAEGKGEFVTEVGFFGEHKTYFLRPKKEDFTDESSVFTLWPFLLVVSEETRPIKMLKTTAFFTFSPLLNILKEPDLGAEYYQGVLNYMLKGTDLNTYINSYFVEDSNTFTELSDPQKLKPVLTYQKDEQMSLMLEEWSGTKKGIFSRLLSLLESVVSHLQTHTASKEEFKLYFGWDLRKLQEMGLTMENMNNDYPFFNQVYQSYENYRTRSLQGGSLDFFIKKYPAVLYDSSQPSWFVVPYTRTEENLPAKLFRRVSQFKKCIESEKKKGVICENREEKRAYIDIVLSHYYQEIRDQEE